jgi:hypothetical protein
MLDLCAEEKVRDDKKSALASEVVRAVRVQR